MEKNKIPVFIVSLAKDTERRKSISDTLKKENIDFEFIDAILGSDLPREELDRIKNNSPKEFNPTISEIGCSLSHQKVYSRIINDNIEWSIILEDDAIINGSLKHLIDGLSGEAIKKMAEEDLYILGGQDGLSQRRKVSLSFFNKININEIIFRKLTYKPIYITRACCYLINKKLAKNLHDEFNKNYYIADKWKYLHDKKCFNKIYLTEIISHPIVDVFNSNIEKERLEKLEQELKKESRKKGTIEKGINEFFFIIKRFLRSLKW
ncbi:glycosyltransferase family 25 protein [Pectobacterium brasiliense]|uniref:glycosyltransferase family 25 protein n=1 Tax=Pectobacterium brasiliense TaxID=180957 RepID=UPI000CE69465|nr:glycosyltransferase family 25 protein [Pectobacterium brasiliense]MBN3098616.1 glycosyltransferase family 25 protein [Pectobacterium brasiliense]MBN3164239.1 glycosyltransferase family 25 protein [Pectobacterium brasiliense]MBN3180950.1 glycosyltransferase family 25 protein [Pectobacterium brasiliense]PPE63288.1 beta-1,4-galactosyltransferase [Pectobacterium brasiliense]